MVFLISVIVILLLLFFVQHYELKSIIKQLKNISFRDSNILIHSENGSRISSELINEINALLCDMHSSRMEYQQKSHHLEQMMTNISHDLRTPLTSAMGYIHLIRHSDLPQEEKEQGIYIVEQRLIRLEELINSFFEFSKIISSGQKPELSQLNLIGVLQEAIVHYYDDFCAQNREIFLICDRSKQFIYSNQNILMRIFDNLISNALKHGSGNLTITVTDHIRIRFENMLIDSALDTNRIFDEFYTTDISRTKGNTGLGLAIAKQFTQILGGEIKAEYDGKIFSVILLFDL